MLNGVIFLSNERGVDPIDERHLRVGNVSLVICSFAGTDRREGLSERSKPQPTEGPAVFGNEDHPRIIEETRQYIRDLERLLEKTNTACELCKAAPVRTVVATGRGPTVITMRVAMGGCRPEGGKPG